MNVKVITQSDKFMENHDYISFFVIEVDGKEKVSFIDGEPEDSTISRNFSGVMSIPALMRSAYEAGKNGQDFILEKCLSDDFV